VKGRTNLTTHCTETTFVDNEELGPYLLHSQISGRCECGYGTGDEPALFTWSSHKGHAIG